MPLTNVRISLLFNITFCDFKCYIGFFIFFLKVYKDPKTDAELETHVGIAHTRWATHGEPSERNSHPQRSDCEHSFVVVHNGIITNYKDVKSFLETKGHQFESETDTEIIAKLIYHLWQEHPAYSFRELVEQVIQQLVCIPTDQRKTQKVFSNKIRNFLSILFFLVTYVGGSICLSLQIKTFSR